MARLVSYNCSNCGAVLNVEQGHKLFDCPFCGADFDYYYFYRKDMLEQAEICLRRMDFAEAKARFQDILAHNPKEFLALRGLVLCEGGIISPKNLTSPEKLKDCQFYKAHLVLNDVLERAREEDKEYFRKLDGMLEAAHEYLKIKEERDSLSKDSNLEFGQIVKVDNKIEETKHIIGSILITIGMIIMAPFADENTSREDWENAGMFAIGVIGVGILTAVLLCFGKFAFLVALGIVILVLGLLFFFRHLEEKAKAPHREKMRKNQDSIGPMVARMSELEKKYSDDYAELQKMVPDDRRREKPDKKALLDPATTEEDKQLVCNKCGGLLFLDRERRLYECRSCGVGYSSALMADTDMLKTAMNHLSKKDFKEADNLFVLALMLDPHDYTALRGRVLCAGRWKDLTDIRLDDTRNSARIGPAAERLEEVIAKSADEDKEYFIRFRDLIDVLKQYSDMQNKKTGKPDNRSGNETAFLASDMNRKILMDQCMKNMNYLRKHELLKARGRTEPEEKMN